MRRGPLDCSGARRHGSVDTSRLVLFFVWCLIVALIVAVHLVRRLGITATAARNMCWVADDVGVVAGLW